MAGIIPSLNPADACHSSMPDFNELNDRLKQLVNSEKYRSRASYLDIPNEFISVSANEYSSDLVHLSPKGAEHLASFIKAHLVSLHDITCNQ